LYTGESEHSIDDKGRIIVPAKFRDDLGDACFLTRGFNNCINLYAKPEFDALMERLKDPTGMDRKAIMLQRRFAATPVSIDNQGRLSISGPLREYAGINVEKSDQRSVVLFGTDDRIEIWAKDRWDAYNKEVTDDDIADAFEVVQSRKAINSPVRSESSV